MQQATAATRFGTLDYSQAIWKCRYFWVSLVQMDLRTRYRRSWLGIWWSLLHPILFTIVLCSVFATLFNRPIATFGPYIMCGLTFWNFLSAVAMDGATCLFRGEPYIRQHPAPLAIYPLRATLGAAFHLMLSLVTVVLVTAALKHVFNPIALLTLIPTIALLLVFGWSLAVLTGLSEVFFPDTRHLLQVGLQLAMYATPIIWLPEMMQKRGLGWIVAYNPLATLVGMLRQPLVYGQAPSLTSYVFTFAIVAVTFAVASVALARLEKRVIFFL